MSWQLLLSGLLGLILGITLVQAIQSRRREGSKKQEAAELAIRVELDVLSRLVQDLAAEVRQDRHRTDQHFGRAFDAVHELETKVFKKPGWWRW